MAAEGVVEGRKHRGMEQKGKRTHGCGQQCGDCWGGESKENKW